MKKQLLLIALALSTAFSATAQEKVLNLYSARHYQTDEKLYENFTKQTGIKINRIEGKEEELMERIRNEGANSPADVFIPVAASRLATADALGLFAPVKSKLLEARIPAHLHTDTWFAFSTRARVIIYNRSVLKADDVPTYESVSYTHLRAHETVLDLVCRLLLAKKTYSTSTGHMLVSHISHTRDQRSLIM